LRTDERGSSLAVGSALDNMTASNLTNISGIVQSVATGAAGAGLGGLNNITTKVTGDANAGAKLLQLGGLAQNPFLTVLYNSPTFKRHTFEWTFIPENPQDAEVLKFIMNKFRYHRMPDLASGSGGLLLTYPDLVLPTIIPTGHLYDFKQCVIESMSISYALGDTPAFAATAPGQYAANAIKFTVKLLEVALWTKGDLLDTSPYSGTMPYAS
jgi:hypothetical protein